MNESPDAVCPFYHRENENKIYCDGISGSSLCLHWKSDRRKEEYTLFYCRKHYKSCPIARMLYKENGGE